MRDQQKIYIQSECMYTRNSDIFNVNMSSDICVYTSPSLNISGATKIIDDEEIYNLSGVTFDNIVLSAITYCGIDNLNCFDYLTWSLEINENNLLVYSAEITSSIVTGNTITQEDVDNSVINAFNTLNYNYTYTGSSFTVDKPYGVEDLNIILCLDINIKDLCKTSGYTICPDGYTYNIGGDMCVKTETTGATYLGSGDTISAGDTDNNYGSGGSRFYENITNKSFPIVRTGATDSSIYYNNTNEVLLISSVVSPFWGDGIYTDGRLNNVGIKGSGTTWHGFAKCYEFDTSGTTYIGLAADNYCRFYINGELIVNFNFNSNRNFNIWHVFPYDFPSGKNIIQMEGKNAGGSHAFGFELYSATSISQLTASTNTIDAGSFWDTSMTIGETFDVGDTVGYSCPSGYTLDLCNVTPICTKILYTGATTGSTYSGDCDMLCTILADNTYETLNSGSTGVYIIDTATTINLGFEFTGNTDLLTISDTTFGYEVYKYDVENNIFSSTSVYGVDNIPVSGFSGTSAFTESIPVSSLVLDGDYLIKGFYVYNYCTEFLNRLGVKVNTLSMVGESYGLYQKAFDFYFTAFKKADKPEFSYSSQETTTLNSLIGYSVFPEYSGQTLFNIGNEYNGKPIIALNGLTLSENYDYTLNKSANTITFSGETVLTDVISIILVSDDKNYGFTNDIIKIDNQIVSGTTNNQGNNEIYYNTTQNKYEIYLSVTPNINDNLIVTLNGLTLSPNIDYYTSITNNKRIILNGVVNVGDIINVYYNSYAQYVGDVYTNTFKIYWGILNPPVNDEGLFTIEVANYNDTSFNTVISSGKTNYVKNVNDYSGQIILSGDVGTKYIYRVKNEKYYTTIIGDKIKTEEYSEIIPIQIQSNAINSY